MAEIGGIGMSKNDFVCVRMFGGFVISYQGTKYNMTQHLNKQPLNLLQYLLLNHEKIVSNEDLYDALWSESKNPKSALKFTIHSLRASLKELFGDDTDWIVSSKGGYRITNQIRFVLDTDLLTEISQKLEGKVELTEKEYKSAMKVMDLYTGHLYMTSSQHFWIMQLAEWYRASFANIVGRICKYLINQGEYERMIKIDYQAILREPFYEGLHYFYIQGLIKTQEYHKAIQYYDEINEAFYKELGTGLSPKFKELYELIEEENKSKILKISEVKKELNDNRDKQADRGGFYCTYDMFKHVYELTSKVAKRENKNYYLILFNVTGAAEIDKKSTILNKLKAMILDSIRSSDICARVADDQFVLLVQCAKPDDTYIIVQRISQLFYKSYSSRQYRLNYSVEDIND